MCLENMYTPNWSTTFNPCYVRRFLCSTVRLPKWLLVFHWTLSNIRKDAIKTNKIIFYPTVTVNWKSRFFSYLGLGDLEPDRVVWTEWPGGCRRWSVRESGDGWRELMITSSITWQHKTTEYMNMHSSLLHIKYVSYFCFCDWEKWNTYDSN